MQFSVEKVASHSRARAGTFQTLHGPVATPVFMPVGTQATVKSQTVERLKETGSHVLLANTYHLMLRPGVEVFKVFGGIHRFMNWNGPVLTDSGGYQIFSLPHSRRIDESGALFQSYVDGKTHLLSPETSISMQRAIGSDIMMVLDQCIASTASFDEAKAALQLTHRWAARSLAARGDSKQALFGIVQGACFENLRRESASALTEMDFDGYAIGGLAVGETKTQREDFTEFTAALLPENKPRYLMGVGTPIDILEAVHRGVDLFDCILPSSLAQRGVAFTSQGKLQLRRSVYKCLDEPLDPACPCNTCQTYSKAYLHHLHKAEETLGWTLITTHNLTFYHSLMRSIRSHILNDQFSEFYAKQRPLLSQIDEAHPMRPQPKVRNPLSKQTTLGDYKIRVSPHGHWSIQQISSTETMHAISNPATEAELLYVTQPRLKERLAEAHKLPLVIWDVGLGAANNAMAAIHCSDSVQSPFRRKLHLISFENDLNPLKLALRHLKHFPTLRHEAPHILLKNGYWENEFVKWELRLGDFKSLFADAPPAHIIFYDLFSSKVDFEPWSSSFLKRLFFHHRDTENELITYSNSTAVRAALLSVGFFVAPGIATGPKTETTRAFTRPLSPLLGEKWLGKWKRSEVQFPKDLPVEAQAQFVKSILEHPQFAETDA